MKRWWVLLVALLAISLLALVLVLRASHEDCRKIIADLQACGEVFEIGKLAPEMVSSPSADSYILAASNLQAEGKDLPKPRGMQPASEDGFYLVGHRSEVPDTGKSSTTWEDFASWCEPRLEQMDAALAAIQAEDFLQHPDYSKGFSVELDFATKSLSFSQLIAATSSLDLKKGNCEAAISKNLALLRLADTLHKQPVLLSQLVANSILSIAQTITWEILQSGQATEPTLLKLQTAWSTTSPSGMYAQAMRFERATAMKAMQGPVDDLVTGILSASSPTPKMESLSYQAVLLAWATLFRSADIKELVLLYQRFIDSIPDANQSWQNHFEVSREIDARIPSLNWSRLFTKLSFPAVGGSSKTFVSAEITKSLTIVAIAIERYRIANNGTLPESLADLVPNQLPAIPLDPIDRQPLRYKRESDSTFLLYSIGMDSTDSGGLSSADPSTKGRRGFTQRMDAVWPKANSVGKIVCP
jgi:hypothetical protein